MCYGFSAETRNRDTRRRSAVAAYPWSTCGSYGDPCIGSSSWRRQLTTDGYKAYLEPVETVLGMRVDYAMLVKVFSTPKNAGPDWYGTGKIRDLIPSDIIGSPDPEHISTSYVERSNLTLRMHLRRFTRLTNGFSKKLDNLKAAVSLYMAWYNFCRVHSTLKVTPAMEAGLTDHVWSLPELLAAA